MIDANVRSERTVILPDDNEEVFLIPTSFQWEIEEDKELGADVGKEASGKDKEGGKEEGFSGYGELERPLDGTSDNPLEQRRAGAARLVI